MRLACVAVLSLASTTSAQIVLEDDVPAEGDYFVLPFDVPEGTVEIEVRHDDLSEENILDWGVLEPGGVFRGYGGGNTEPAVIGVDASSRSYLPGPIPAGEWVVYVGKAKVDELPARYRVEIDLRTVATLEPDTTRRPYVHAPALESTARWYAGDFHVHSVESGDASASIDEVLAQARSVGLDFVMLSEHNTTSHVDRIGAFQDASTDVLIVPGVEFTTYAGHANGIGSLDWVDHRIGYEGGTIEGAIQRFRDRDVLFSINHPTLGLGDACIGCGWDHDVDPTQIDGVEIQTGAWRLTGALFSVRAIQVWDDLLEAGSRAAALGGSDDHQGGMGTGAFDSPIGSPTTMVWAEELSVPAIMQGIREGRTMVKMESNADPIAELTAGEARIGDTVDTPQVDFTIRVTGADVGDVAFLVRNNQRVEAFTVDADPFEVTYGIEAPYGDAPDRYRVDVYADTEARVITSVVWVAPQEGEPPPDAGALDASTGADAGSGGDGGGCGCRTTSSGGASSALLLLVLCARRRAQTW